MSHHLPALRALAAAALLACTAAADAADYRYWYYDENGNHDPGALTNGNAALPAPDWACARRFLSGAQLQWIGEYGAGVGADNGGQDVYNAVNAHFGTGPGCKPRPRLENHPAGSVIKPRVGSHYVVIDPDAGSYYVDKDGGWPACNCAAPVGFKAMLADVRWASLFGLFDLQLERGSFDRGWIAIDSVSIPLQRMHESVAAEVSRRRLTTLPTIETAVRQLEDQALASLADAAGRVEQCRVSQDRGDAAAAYRSCDQARRSAIRARGLLQVVLQEMR